MPPLCSEAKAASQLMKDLHRHVHLVGFGFCCQNGLAWQSAVVTLAQPTWWVLVVPLHSWDLAAPVVKHLLAKVVKTHSVKEPLLLQGLSLLRKHVCHLVRNSWAATLPVNLGNT